MPDLIEVIRHLVHQMKEQRYNLPKQELYATWFEDLGGEESVAQDALRCVEPAFLKLIGQEITVQV
jgi:hypothetical protein